ncbi:arabinose transporter [Telmatospirillum sp.]|uniref:arabinose transporter n=1 Tax=Telmatospirillum sp. TaxID=2079197 RepID=UPI002850E849|nr:arabinose transporter [Telmatospirillum sp.]MDR3435719.1 arabinose transporter [Telmatospirillum sp.]
MTTAYNLDEISTPPVIRRLLPLNGIILLGFMVIGMPLPVLPLFVHATMTTSPLTVGLVIGLQSISTVLTRRYAGTLADRMGAKTATVRGLAICAGVGAIYILCVMIPVSWTIQLAILLLGRLVLGLGESLILTGAITWGIGRVGIGNAGSVMSWNGIAMYAALASGAPLGLAVYGAFDSASAGFVALGAVSTILPLVALAIAVRLTAVAVTPERRVSGWTVLKRIWSFGSVLTLQMVGFGTIASFLSLTYATLGWDGAGLAFTGFGIAVIAVRFVWGHLPDRIGGRSVAVVSLVVDCIGQMLIWLAPVPMVAMAGAIVTGMGLALAFPALGIEAMRRVPPASKGLVVALFSAFQDIAFGITGPLTAVVVSLFGYQSVFAAGAVSSLLALLLLASTKKDVAT